MAPRLELIEEQTSNIDPASPENNINLSKLDTDVLVVGAGIVGLCFARDVASLGYSVTIVEKSAKIGGVWATNYYSGLRLHAPGHSYRCLSVVPSWNLEHDYSEGYRPTRDEILEYCHEIAEHENIKILLNTNCFHKDHKVLKEGGISVQIDKAGCITSRFLFVSGSWSNKWTGVPQFPSSLPENFQSIPGFPTCVHSSQLSVSKLKSIRETCSRVVIIGSGKASLDILQLFPKGDASVLWAHRGHSAFFKRERIQQSENAYAILSELITECSDIAKAEGLCRDWSDVALEKGYLHKCNGPLTRQKVKTAQGICCVEEISHANSFQQYNLQSVEQGPTDHSLVLKSINGEEGDSVHLTCGAAVIFCTGQQNPNFVLPMIGNGYACSGNYSACVPMSSLTPLCLAVQQLQGDKRLSSRVHKCFTQWRDACKLQLFNLSGREGDMNIASICREVNGIVFQADAFSTGVRDPAAHPNWAGQWYSTPVQMEDISETFAINKSSDITGNQIATRHHQGLCINSEVVEETLIRILADLMDVEQHKIQPSTKIGELGLPSLKIIEFIRQVVDTFGVELSPIVLFEFPMVQDLAICIRRGGSEKAEEEIEDASFYDHTRVLDKLFVRQSHRLGKDPMILLCFPGLPGSSAISYARFASKFSGNDIVPFLAQYPWEKEAKETTEELSVENYIEDVCKAIAQAISCGYYFSIFGHCAGASVAYIVEHRLQSFFDVSPLTSIMAEATPPHLSRVGNKTWLSWCLC